MENKTENEIPQNIVIEGQSVAYIKLIKNTKGYNWEIKQLSLDVEALEILNLELLNRFSAQEA